MATVETEAPACAKAAGNSYTLHLRQGAPLLDSTSPCCPPCSSTTTSTTSCPPHRRHHRPHHRTAERTAGPSFGSDKALLDNELPPWLSWPRPIECIQTEVLACMVDTLCVALSPLWWYMQDKRRLMTSHGDVLPALMAGDEIVSHTGMATLVRFRGRLPD